MSISKEQICKILLLILTIAFTTGSPALAGNKPKVLEFYASWAAPCRQLKPAIEKARAEYGQEVEFVSYDVDDPACRKIIEQYEVCPIPTVIFLDQNNNVSTYTFGCSSENLIQKGINKILPLEKKAELNEGKGKV